MIDTARFAFRGDGGGFSASADTHRVRVDGDLVSVTPINFDGVERQVGKPIEIRTIAVRRGDADLDMSVAQTGVDAKGAIRIARGGLVENFYNRAGGVEQTWSFQAMPEGEGDLNLDIDVAGHEFVKESRDGLHFATPGGLGFRYGNAVLIDANGEEYALQARFDNGLIALTVPADVVDTVAYPIVIDPIISGEVAAQVPVNGHTGAGARDPAVAYGGGQYLVVWQDDRNSREAQDIYGVRVNQAGTLLDAQSIAIDVTAGRQANPTVAFVGGGFVVAWEDYQVPAADPHIKAATVSSTGVVTALGAVASTAAAETEPRAVGRGTGALLVWQSDSDVRGAVFAGGAFGAPFDIAASGNVEKQPAVAANPSGDYLVTWAEGAADAEDLRGQRVTSAGALNGAVIDISVFTSAQRLPSVAWNGTSFFVVFQNRTSDIFGTRVDTAGTVLDTRLEGAVTVGGVPISVAAAIQNTPSISCRTQNCLVTWADRRNITTNGYDIRAQLVTSTMTLSGAEFIVSAPLRSQLEPNVANDGIRFMVVWYDQRAGDAIVGSRVSAVGAVAEPSGISFVVGTDREQEPAVARSSATSLVHLIWSDSAKLGRDILATRYDSTLASRSVRVVTEAAMSQIEPSVAFLGPTFLNVWADQRNASWDIYAGRTQESGDRLDAADIAITNQVNDQRTPDVAAGAGSALVTWIDRRNGSWDIFGAMVNAAGTVTVADFPICAAAGDQVSNAVSYDPVNDMYVVAWADGGTVPTSIRVARVTGAGSVVDPCGVVVAGGGASQVTPDIASIGGNHFLVWDDRRSGNADIFGARLSATAGALTVIDVGGRAISTAGGAQTRPRVAGLAGSYGGSLYMVAWTDARTGGANGTDIYASSLDAATGVIMNDNLVVSAEVGNESLPVVAASVASQAVVAYIRERTDLATQRVAVRSVRFGTTVGRACSSDAACETGFCVDGRCCDSACGGNNTGDCQACSATRGASADGICTIVPASRAWVCRPYVHAYCDLKEVCNGVDPTCPADVGRNPGKVCNAGTGAVCPSAAPGTPHVCPI